MAVPWLKTSLEPQGYACLDADGSLKPVPPGKTQQDLYCGECRAERCLWEGRKLERKRKRERKKREDSRAQMARYRARGLNACGDPLTPSCWNCVHLRQVGDRQEFVCKFLWPGELPKGMRVLTLRTVAKTGCKRFEMRLVVEIPRLLTLRQDSGQADLENGLNGDEDRWEEEDYCPECGAFLDDLGACYECGWMEIGD